MRLFKRQPPPDREPDTRYQCQVKRWEDGWWWTVKFLPPGGRIGAVVDEGSARWERSAVRAANRAVRQHQKRQAQKVQALVHEPRVWTPRK